MIQIHPDTLVSDYKRLIDGDLAHLGTGGVILVNGEYHRQISFNRPASRYRLATLEDIVPLINPKTLVCNALRLLTWDVAHDVFAGEKILFSGEFVVPPSLLWNCLPDEYDSSFSPKKI